MNTKDKKWKCPKCGREFSRQGQDHYCVKTQTIDEYIALQDEKVHPRLNRIRTILRNAIPDAEERISWSMPTYWKDRNIIHFAAFKKHIGPNVKIKAAGGIRTREQMVAFLKAGCDRIGCSAARILFDEA